MLTWNLSLPLGLDSGNPSMTLDKSAVMAMAIQAQTTKVSSGLLLKISPFVHRKNHIVWVP